MARRAGQSRSALPLKSDVDLFCYCQGIIDLDAKVPNRALDFGMPKQELNGPQVASTTVDEGCLCSTKRMRPEQPRVEPDTGHLP